MNEFLKIKDMYGLDNKFKNGDYVYEKVRPFQMLTVVNFLNGLYYCQIHERDSQKQLVYFENELKQYTHFKMASD